MKTSEASEPSRRERSREATRVSLDAGQRRRPVTKVKKAKKRATTMTLPLGFFDFFNLAPYRFSLVLSCPVCLFVLDAAIA